MKFANVSSWLASVACGVCLVLAVLATPGVAKADPPCACCGDPPPPGASQEANTEWNNCMSWCLSHNNSCSDAPFCYPKPNRDGCTQGLCGFYTTCHDHVEYDLYGGANCCW